MKKAYLVFGISGEWEDYSEGLVDTRFDKCESDEILSKFRVELDNKRQELLGLEVHVENCLEDRDESCKKCDEFFDLQFKLYDINGYRQVDVNVCEEGEVWKF